MTRFLLILLLFLSCGSLYAHEDSRLKEQTAQDQVARVLKAARVNPEPPLIDGVLDDEVWRSSPMSTGLRQMDPDAGEPATERTEIRVVYDDEAIYFGVVCYDQRAR